MAAPHTSARRCVSAPPPRPPRPIALSPAPSPEPHPFPSPAPSPHRPGACAARRTGGWGGCCACPWGLRAAVPRGPGGPAVPAQPQPRHPHPQSRMGRGRPGPPWSLPALCVSPRLPHCASPIPALAQLCPSRAGPPGSPHPAVQWGMWVLGCSRLQVCWGWSQRHWGWRSPRRTPSGCAGWQRVREPPPWGAPKAAGGCLPPGTSTGLPSHWRGLERVGCMWGQGTV